MLDFPKSTEFKTRIPKQKFYDNLTVSTAAKRVFVDQIKVIYWRNKLSTETLNVEEGQTVKEIEIIEIELYQQDFDKSVLQLINKGIPYNIVFLLKYDDKAQLVISYQNLYCTEWLKQDELSLTIKGLTLDEVWNNFVKQIGNIEVSEDVSLDEQIAINERIEQINKQIAQLERKRNSEKQFNRQVEINNQIKELKSELREIQNG